MIRSLVASLGLLALVACNQAGAPQAAGDAPGGGEAAQGGVPQVTLTPAERAQFETLVRQYLDQSAQRNAQGFAAVAGAEGVAALQPNGDHRFTADLRRGVSYRVIGACDNECNDMDIEVLDPAGAVIASDVTPTDFPAVNLTPAADGRYTVRFILKTCTIAPCFVGARVLQAS